MEKEMKSLTVTPGCENVRPHHRGERNASMGGKDGVDIADQEVLKCDWIV